MKRERSLVDSCYSNSDAVDGAEAENSEQNLSVNICLYQCVCGGCSSMCVKWLSAQIECEVCAAHMWTCVAGFRRVCRLYVHA